MLADQEERPGLRGRLDRAQAALSGDRTYRHALQIHHSADNLLEKLEAKVDRKRPKDAEHFISAMRLTYQQEMRSVGLISVSTSDGKDGISPHFMLFAINHLPEGPTTTPLKAMLGDALRFWRIQHPNKPVVPLCSTLGKPVTSAERPR